MLIRVAISTADLQRRPRAEAPLLVDPLSDKARLITYEGDEDAFIAVPAAGIDDVEERRAKATQSRSWA